MPDTEDLAHKYDELKAAVGAETLLRVLGPLFQDRLETLCANLALAKPELEVLLDYRAKLTETLRIIRELRALAGDKQNASAALTNIFQQDLKASPPRRRWWGGSWAPSGTTQGTDG